MKVYHCSVEKAFFGIVLLGIFVVMMSACTNDAPQPSSQQTVVQENPRESFEKTIRSYQDNLCKRKLLELGTYLCEPSRSPKPGSDGPWQKYYTIGSVCRSIRLESIELGPQPETAQMEATLDQEIYPPTGSGSPLYRQLKIREKWKQIEGRWCVEEGHIIGTSFSRGPDNHSTAPAN